RSGPRLAACRQLLTGNRGLQCRDQLTIRLEAKPALVWLPAENLRRSTQAGADFEDFLTQMRTDSRGEVALPVRRVGEQLQLRADVGEVARGCPAHRRILRTK